MSKPNGKWSYDFSWTQPYLPMSYNPFYSPSPNPAQDEIERLDAVDQQIDLMDRYPDAEAMIERLKRDFLED